MALVGPQLHNLQDHMENQIRTFFSGGWFPKVSSSRDGKCMYSVALLLKLVAQAHLQVISGVLKVVAGPSVTRKLKKLAAKRAKVPVWDGK